MNKHSGARCYACGDPADKRFNGKPVCEDCYDELKYGKIKNQNINFIGGRAAVMEDDGGPWQQNAVREMEG